MENVNMSIFEQYFLVQIRKTVIIVLALFISPIKET